MLMVRRKDKLSQVNFGNGYKNEVDIIDREKWGDLREKKTCKFWT